MAKAAKLGPSPTIRKELRDEAIAALQLTDVRLIREVKATNHRVWFVFDARLENYAAPFADESMKVLRSSDQKQLSQFKHGKLNDPWRFSPDGRWLAVNELNAEGQAEISFRDSATGNEVYRLRGSICAFRSDSAQALVWMSGATQAAITYNLADGRELRRIETGQGGAWPTVDRDFRRLAVVWGEKVKIWSLETGEAQGETSIPGFRSALSWHPSGEMLAYATIDRRLMVRDLRNNTIQMTTDTLRAPISYSQFNRQGDLLASVGWDEQLRVFDAMSGQFLISIPGGAPEFFDFSENDQWLGSTYHEGKRQIWEVVKGANVCRRYSGPYDSQDDSRVDFSLDGQIIVLGGSNDLAAR